MYKQGVLAPQKVGKLVFCWLLPGRGASIAMFPSFSSHPLPSHRKIAVRRDGAASTKNQHQQLLDRKTSDIASWKQHETICLTFCWLYNNTSRGYLGIFLKTSKILVTWMSSASLSYGKRYQSRNTSRSLASKHSFGFVWCIYSHCL